MDIINKCFAKVVAFGASCVLSLSLSILFLYLLIFIFIIIIMDYG